MKTSLNQSNVFYHIHSDLEGRYTYANAHYRTTFIALGNDLNTFDSSEKLDATTLQQAYLAQKKILNCSSTSEIVNLKKEKVSGEMIWTEWEFLPIFDEQEVIIGVSCIGYDIPDYLEKALEQSNHNQHIINSFADSSAAQISLKDENFDYIMCNQQLSNHLKLDKNEIYLKNDNAFYTTEIAKQILDTDIATSKLPIGGVINMHNTVNDRFYSSQKFPVLLKNGLVGIGCITMDVTDKIRFKKELQAKELFLKNLTDNINGVVTQFRVKSNETAIWEFVSNGIEKIFEISAETLKEKPNALRNMIPPAELEIVLSNMDYSLQKLIPSNYQHTITTPSGIQKWIEVTAIPKLQDDKSIIWYGFHQDITTKKKLELENKVNQDLILNITNNLNAVVTQFKIDKEGNHSWSYMSKNAEALYEVLVPDIIKDSNLMISLIHPDDLLEVYSSEELSIVTRSPLYNVRRIITPNGKLKWIEVNAYPEIQADGSHIWNGFHMDITERKLLELENKKNEELLKNLTNNIEGAIIQVRHKELHEPIWEFVSHGVRKLFGIDSKHLIRNPKALREMVIPEDLEKHEREIEFSYNNNTILQSEMRIKTNSGKQKWICLKSTPTKEKNGDVVWRGFYEDITTTKLLELENKKNQDLINNLNNNVDVVLSQIKYTDYNNPQWQYISKGVEKLYEVTFNDLQKNPNLIREMAGIKIFEDLNRRILASKITEKILIEFQITTPSGIKKWVQTSTTPKFEADNSIIIHAFHLDITAKKELENQIIENEKLLKSLTNNVNGMLTQLQVFNENTISWNFLSDGVENLYEITKQEISDNNFVLFQLVHPLDYERTRINFLKCQNKNTLFFSQHRIITKNGNEKWIEISSTPNRQKDGSTIWNGFHQDITQQKKLEIRNRQTQEQLDFIVNNTVAALILIENNQIAYISKNYETIFGFTIEEDMNTINEKIWNLVHFEEERKNIKKQSIDALKKQDKNIVLQYQYLHKNGKIIWRQDRINLFYNEEGRAVKIVNIVSDITKTKRLENLVHRKNEQLALQIVEKDKITENFVAFQNSKWEEIAANLHDNISQLLFATNLHLNNFTNSHSSYEKAKDILQIALNEIKYITQATKNLVIQDKGLQLALKEFIDNNNYLNNIKITKIANTEFYKHFSNSEQIILFTIIQEIIQNAIKHSKSTDIYLILSIENESYFVKVIDNGVGMPTNYVSGMGIYNIEKNVRLLNGTIKMYNDEGLTVEINLN